MGSCTKILTLPQIDGTCWFNAFLTSFFFSDGMGVYLKDIISTLIKKESILKQTIKLVKRRELLDLMNLLLEVGEVTDPKHMKQFYSTLSPQNLLQILHDNDRKTFFFNPKVHAEGLKGEFYILAFMHFLQITDRVLFVTKEKKYIDGRYGVLFSGLNGANLEITIEDGGFGLDETSDPQEPDTMKLLSENMDYKNIDIIVSTDFFDMVENFQFLPFVSTIQDGNVISLGYRQYILDSMTLSNFNRESCGSGHQIAGVTCGNKKYLYNGYIDKRNIPFIGKKTESCRLIKYDWTKKTNNICLSGCEMSDTNLRKNRVKDIINTDVCFNVGKNDTRIYVIDKTQRIPLNRKKKYNIPQRMTINSKSSNESIHDKEEFVKEEASLVESNVEKSDIEPHALKKSSFWQSIFGK
jgi:hypothetical protein